MIFQRSKRRRRDANSTTEAAAAREVFSSTGEILAEIERLSPANGAPADPVVARRMLRLRHLAGIGLVREAAPEPRYPEPDAGWLSESGVPEVAPSELEAGVLRAGILAGGCMLVRGAIDRELSEQLAAGIERAFRDRDAHLSGAWVDGSIYDEFSPEPEYPPLAERPWIAEGGGVLGVDAPTLLASLLGAFDRIGLAGVIGNYLGEPAVFSAQKCTLRKADPSVGGAWHQDGNFMGDVRALNVWLSLSRCGDIAPGLDVVPRRIEDLVPAGTDGAPLSYVISPRKVEEVAGETGILRPIFEPGDLLLFDDRFLHQTGSDPSMPNPRYAVESWFFGASGFPEDFAPLAA